MPYSPAHFVATFAPDVAPLLEHSGSGESVPLPYCRLEGYVSALVPDPDGSAARGAAARGDAAAQAGRAASRSGSVDTTGETPRSKRGPAVPPAPTFRRGKDFSIHLGQLLPFVFPAGIRLYDPRRVSMRASGEPAAAPRGATRSLQVVLRGDSSPALSPVPLCFHDPASVASGGGSIPVHSSLHTFMCTSQTANAEPYYGHVLTRWHPITDAPRVGFMRMQLAARAMLRSSTSEGTSGDDLLSSRRSRGSSALGESMWFPGEPDPSAAAGSDLLAPASQCWEPSALLIVTSEPYYEAMRAILSSLDAHLAPGEALGGSAAALVYAALQYPSKGGGTECPHDVLEGEAHVSCGLVDLRTADAGMRVSRVAFPPDERTPPDFEGHYAAQLPWCNSACAAASAHIADAHVAFSPFVVLPPTHSHSWELPQQDWTCAGCRALKHGLSRSRVHALQAEETSSSSQSPLSARIRCVETGTCLECTALEAGVCVSHDEFLPAGVRDPLLTLLPSDDLRGLESRAEPNIPLPFALPNAGTSLPTLDLDPRALFAHVQPRHVIALVTALLAERKVLVVSRDTSRLVDVIGALLALLHPLPWAGCVVPLLPPYGLPPVSDLVSSAPIPVLVGCHPDTARASPPAYHQGHGLATKHSNEAVAAAIEGWEQVDKVSSKRSTITGSLDSGCCTASGIDAASSNTGPWRPVPPRWWLRYAHLLDPAVGAWALADADADAEAAVTEAARLRLNEKSSAGNSWWRKPSTEERSPPLASIFPSSTPDGSGSHDDGYGYVSTPPANSFWNGKGEASDNWWGAGGEDSRTLVSSVLQSTWTATVGLGMALPPATANEGDTEDRADLQSLPPKQASSGLDIFQGSTPLRGAKTGKRSPLSSASLIIIDIDADALSPAYLPPTHLLPARLAARLWRACNLYAPLWAWTHYGAPLPPPLPHFSISCDVSDVMSAQALWGEYRAHAQKKGWGREGPLHIVESSRGGDKHDANVLRLDSVFMPSHRQPIDDNYDAPPFTRSPASLRTLDYLYSDEEDDDASSPSSSIDSAPLPLTPPWALWRMNLSRQQSGTAISRVLPVHVDGVRTQLLVPEPPLHFARLRLAFMSVLVSLLKAYRLYATVVHANKTEDEGHFSTEIATSPISDGALNHDEAASPSTPLTTLSPLGLSELAQPFLRSLGPSHLVHRPLAHSADDAELQLDNPPAAVIAHPLNESIVQLTLSPRAVAAASITLASHPQWSPQWSSSALHSASTSTTVVAVRAPPPPSQLPMRVHWDVRAFLAAEAASSSCGVEPLLSHLTTCLHWSAFVDARLCRRWEAISVHLASVRRWREAVIAGRSAARDIAAQSAEAPVLLLPPAPLPPDFPEPDLFDRSCFRRLVARSTRHSTLCRVSFSGIAWKAMRGTLCKGCSRRLLTLSPSGVLAYYARPDEILAAEATVERSQASAAEATIAAATGKVVDVASAEAACVVATTALSALRRDCYRDSFILVPGRTLLRIPPILPGMFPTEPVAGVTFLPFANDGTSFPTRFPLQIVNPAVGHSSALTTSSDGGSVLISSSGSLLAGSRADSLTLCFASASERRVWILRLRAHLRAAVPSWLEPPSKTAATPQPGDDSRNASLRGPLSMSSILTPALVEGGKESGDSFLRLLYLGDVSSLAASAEEGGEVTSGEAVSAAEATSEKAASQHDVRCSRFIKDCISIFSINLPEGVAAAPGEVGDAGGGDASVQGRLMSWLLAPASLSGPIAAVDGAGDAPATLTEAAILSDIRANLSRRLRSNSAAATGELE